MRWCRYLLVGALLLGGALPAPAGIFSKKKKAEPGQRVPELLQIVKQDKDDRKRASAAEELRQYDPAQFPQIVPVLVDVLQSDPRPGVRNEAAHSLGKLRPVSQSAGQALEKAAHDSSMRVRLQARTSLMFYHMAGYSSAKKPDAKGPTVGPRTDEPPLAAPSPPPVTRVAPPATPAETAPPPLAAPPAPAPTSQYRPLPNGSVPTQTAPPLQNVPDDQGPVLTPPP